MLTQDSHLRLDYDPARAGGGDDTAELMRRHFEQARRNNFGFITLKEIPGKRMTDVPVHILVDGLTHSAASPN